MRVALYFDEDAQDSDLIQALGLRGADVVGAWAAGMRERKDEEHLLWAATQKRALYKFQCPRLLPLAFGISRPRQITCRDHSRQATTLLRRRTDAEVAQTDSDQACGRNDKPHRVSQSLGII